MLALSVFTAGSVPLSAHTGSEGGLPLTPLSLRLQHQRPTEILALFAREQLLGPTEHLPRAAVNDDPESLLPSGVQALYRTQNFDELVLVATEGASDVEACIRELDVPVRLLSPDRQQVVVTLRSAAAARLCSTILRLPEAGSATVAGGKLTLTGKPGWLHRALRSVLRAELRIPEPPAIRRW